LGWIRHQKTRVLLGLLLTFATIHLIGSRLVVLFLLILSWTLLFHPLSAAELVIFVVAALFFLLQNYVCLRAGLFAFRFQDILLMPYYEPALWGFYFISLKRFITGNGKELLAIDKKAVAGLVATSIAFSLFSFDSRALFMATSASTALLLAMFHTKLDIAYALHALALGFVVELFGVSTGLWSYPAPDFLGIPYWFATMWMSVGLLGHRFLIPAAEGLAARART